MGLFGNISFDPQPSPHISWFCQTLTCTRDTLRLFPLRSTKIDNHWWEWNKNSTVIKLLWRKQATKTVEYSKIRRKKVLTCTNINIKISLHLWNYFSTRPSIHYFYTLSVRITASDDFSHIKKSPIYKNRRQLNITDLAINYTLHLNETWVSEWWISCLLKDIRISHSTIYSENNVNQEYIWNCIPLKWHLQITYLHYNVDAYILSQATIKGHKGLTQF